MNTALKPKAISVLSECEIENELGLYDSRNNSVHLLNSTAATIWWMCDGENTLDEISAQVADAYGMSVDSVNHDVAEIIVTFRDVGLITLS